MANRKRRKWLSPGRLALAVMPLALLGAMAWMVTNCGWDPSEPFVRQSPAVDEAIELYDAEQYPSAEEALEAYLGTGACSDSGIGLPPSVRDKHDASFDLGLVLFKVAESFGQPFGQEEGEQPSPSPAAPPGQGLQGQIQGLLQGQQGKPPGQPATDPDGHDPDSQRGMRVECAQIIVKAIASDPKVPFDLRARAYYLAGNLEMLRQSYEDAVLLYNQALEIVPAIEDDQVGDPIGRDAAHNRAIALRRLQEEKEREEQEKDEQDEQDQQDDSEGGGGGKPESSDDQQQQDQDDGEQQKSQDSQDGQDQEQPSEDTGEDEQQQAENEKSQPEAPEDEQEVPPSNQMYRILEQLDEASSYQEEAARRAPRTRQVMEDK